MRRPLFIAMIFLLLLRGWVGDAMATGMAAGHLHEPSTATEFIASQVQGSRAGGHFGHEMASEAAPSEAVPSVAHGAASHPDCAGHSAEAASAPLSAEATDHCDSCAACQACHTVALSSVTPNASSIAVSPVLVDSPAAQFASAIAALGQKPPIS